MVKEHSNVKHERVNNRWVADTRSFRYFMVACSDCPTPASQIIDAPLTEILVHSNLGNLVLPLDLSCMASLEFAVTVHKAESVVICGHYECRSLQDATGGGTHVFSGSWLRPINTVAIKYRELAGGASVSGRLDLLSELNVLEQALSACRTISAIDGWNRGELLTVRSVIVDSRMGQVRDLNFTVSASHEISQRFEAAIENLRERWKTGIDYRSGGNFY